MPDVPRVFLFWRLKMLRKGRLNMFIPPPAVLTSYWRCAKYRIFFKENIQGRETQHTMKALSEVMR